MQTQFFAITMSLVLSSLAHASIVYRNNTTPTGSHHEILANGAASGPEHGNQVALAGTDRVVTNLSFVMRILGPGAASFKYQVRLYANDGAGGQPGTQLWESAQQFGGIDGGANLTYGVAVPDILVPDTFTWTVQLTDRQTFFAPIGIATFSPPTVGSATPGYWANSGGTWSLAGQAEAPFGGSITAVPTPGALVAPGIGALLARRRPRR